MDIFVLDTDLAISMLSGKRLRAIFVIQYSTYVAGTNGSINIIFS